MSIVELNLDVNEIFRDDNEFEMLMLQVFSAREDIYVSNKLLLREDLTRTELLFLFKIIIGITREANELLREIYKKYIDKVMSFFNYEQIMVQKGELDKANNGTGKDNFSYLVTRELRNQTFHYKDIKNTAKLLRNSKHISSSLNIGVTTSDTEYMFTQEMFYKYVEDVWKQYNNESSSESITNFIKLMSTYSLCVVKNLEILIEGYLGKYTNLTDENFYNHNLKRKH